MADPKHPVKFEQPVNLEQMANPEQMANKTLDQLAESINNLQVAEVRDVEAKQLVITTLTHAQDLLNFHKVLASEHQKEVEAFKKLRLELEVCLRSGSFSKF